MADKMKIKTRHEGEAYELSRKRAMTLTFAKMQEILQRNVNRNINKSYTQYTRDMLANYARSPANSLDNIREVSRFLLRVSMLYKLMIAYLAAMPKYNYNITPLSDYTVDYDPESTMKNYEKVLKSFSTFNMPKEMYNILHNTIRDGMYVGFMYYTRNQGMFLMPLDIRYCRIYGKTPEGHWIVYFDATYFNSGENGIYVTGINDDGVGVWDQVFVDGYNAYVEDTNARWFRLPPEKTFCMIAGTDDEFDVPLPYYFPLFNSLLRILDTEDLVADKEELQNYKLILNKIPLIKNSAQVDDFAISLDIVNMFDEILNNSVPDLVGVATVPYDQTDVVDFTNSASVQETDELNKAINNLFSNAGINRLIVSSGDSSNANGIRYGIANDLAKVTVYLRRAEFWLNYWITENVAKGFKLEIFNQTWYNSDDFVKEKKDAASFGASKMDYLCAMDSIPYVAYNKLKFEALALNPLQYMQIMQSSYTTSGNGEVKEAGRPEKSDDELTEEGQATRDLGKNDDRGQ